MTPAAQWPASSPSEPGTHRAATGLGTGLVRSLALCLALSKGGQGQQVGEQEDTRKVGKVGGQETNDSGILIT